MALTNEQVEHVAMLARLGLNDEERERMREQLSSILAHIDQLSTVDTSNVPPTAQVIPLEPLLREDVVQPSADGRSGCSPTPPAPRVGSSRCGRFWTE